MSIYKDFGLDGPAPGKDRFQEFLNNSAYILKLLYNIDYHPNVTKRTFTEKLTKYPSEGNMECIRDLITLGDGTKSLIIAPTGSGKTYSIDTIFKGLKSEEKQILCLLCPNRVQNIQNEASDDYSFEALIEGVHLEESGQNTRQISAVYDKILDIRRFKSEHPDYSLRIVIDECQNLVSANIFREKAIKSIMKLVNDRIADSYTFITATYESMCCIPFDNIILFEDKDYRPVFKSIDVRFAEQGSFENLVMDTATKEGRPYIRLNSREMIKRISRTLSGMGQKCFSVTSDDKGYRTNEDGTVTYNNIIFEHITNHDDLYNNDGEADTILATSLLDAGTNFKKYSPKSTPVFAVFSPKLMNIDEIEQAFNRFRPQKADSGNIIQLEHAIILQQLPSAVFERIRIMQHHADGSYSHISSIPAKAVTYTEATGQGTSSTDENCGTITIPGKFFSGLGDGKYNLEFVIGNNTNLCMNSLYVNCMPEMDFEKQQQKLNFFTESIYPEYKEGKASVNTLIESAMGFLDSLTDEYAFFYKTGDVSVSAKSVTRPVTYFYSLTYILESHLKQARKQLARFHAYRRADMEAQNTAQSTTACGDDTYITLPSLNIPPQCSHVRINNEAGVQIVSISCLSDGRVHFINEDGKKLITVRNTGLTLSVTVFGSKYPESGALTVSEGRELKIIPAPVRDEAGKESWNFDRTDISPVFIADTIHHFRAVIKHSTDTLIGGLTQKEYLESHLNMFRLQNPAIGNTLYFTPQMQLRIDYHKLFNSAYSAYQNQYYYHPERLLAELHKRLNIPVTSHYYNPDTYGIADVAEDRASILQSLNTLYKNPATRDTLCSILHHGKNIPADMEDGQRMAVAKILQSRLYNSEYKSLRKISETISFDYIIRALNLLKNEKATNKHIKKLEYMFINQAIERKGTLPFSSRTMQMQFTEQKTLIGIITRMKKESGTKKFTVSDSFMESLNEKFNIEMKSILSGYKGKSRTQFKNLLNFVYIIINKNSKSRKPELTEPILSIDDIPFE